MEEILKLLKKAREEIKAEVDRVETQLDVLEEEYTQASEEYKQAEDDRTISDENFKAISAKSAKARSKYNRKRCDWLTIDRACQSLNEAISQLRLYTEEWD
jgi:chromosome segregation ATPase